MQLGQLLLEAISLLFIGMLVVGTFLGILVLIIPLLDKIVPNEPLPTPAPRQNISTTDTPEQDTLIAVISAAIAQYRKNN